MIDRDTLIEALADLEHDRWSRWHRYMITKCRPLGTFAKLDMVIPEESVSRWNRQVLTEYKDLSEPEKESDRKEARKTIALLEKLGVVSKEKSNADPD